MTETLSRIPTTLRGLGARSKEGIVRRHWHFRRGRRQPRREPTRCSASPSPSPGDGPSSTRLRTAAGRPWPRLLPRGSCARPRPRARPSSDQARIGEGRRKCWRWCDRDASLQTPVSRRVALTRAASVSSLDIEFCVAPDCRRNYVRGNAWPGGSDYLARRFTLGGARYSDVSTRPD